jgi:phosphohistidine swiveling domain-containing protein
MLEESRRQMDDSCTKTVDDPVLRARQLLDATRMHGTLPFSILARHAFIGVAFLKSMVARNILDVDDVNRFMTSIHTVATDLVQHMADLSSGRMKQDAFLSQYGHLRPGTYDILSARYDETPQAYLGHAGRKAISHPPFILDDRKKTALEKQLAREGFLITADALFDYISTAISAREEAKFIFTRGISDALVAIAEWGDAGGIARNDISFLRIENILEHCDDPQKTSEITDKARIDHKITRALHLPHLIVEPDDIDVVRPLRGTPNFITDISVTARSHHLSGYEVTSLDGRIVLIESADPGFDWIFSHNIAALITKYGGANSHMAIRCAEFGLPAAIGCGEKIFDELVQASVIELNCAVRSVRPADG